MNIEHAIEKEAEITDLSQYGFTTFFEKQITEEDKNKNLIPARVIEIHREVFKVVSSYGQSTARLKGANFYAENTSVEYPAIGDFVMIQKNQGGEDIIYRLLDRKSFFSRANPTLGMGEQVVATNFDYVFLMESLNFDFNLAKLERYLTVAWESGGSPVVILTKADLCEEVEDYVEQVESIAPGVDIFPISSVTGEGLEEVLDYIKPGKTVVFLGSSGIGKSSLVNALAGEEVMETNEIREIDSRGRHTTTHRQLILLPNNRIIIDTPGMRTLGIWNANDGVSETFSDVEDITRMCKFSNCNHDSEPGCAVKEALENGNLTMKRWKSYLKLKREARFMERKARMSKQTMKIKKKGK
ncbi:ribosome small subunit-dependent GTPase A [Anaeromicropila herbilytica]|nr:ribosome small subunit-dependent GTPase A [Anaeromicropila herbilytica]